MLGFLSSLAGRILALTVALGALWLLLSFYFDEPTLLGFGAMSVAVTVWLTHHLGILDREGVPTRVFPGILPYMFWLTVEIGKANVIVVREVLRPTLRLSPKMIRVPANQVSDLGRTIFGNSVTLTPGTITVDVDRDTLVIHALTEALADQDAIGDMGDRVTAFDRAEPRTQAVKC
ncbi:Na+/H+ antiporter subunit E [Parvularcula dongshanensis]|uniref:Multicomponent Na+:H+ antiporter subunit E n=1 Tax=Parvularcula dongshanensis TaxID=1173995 RepID=A0A840I398_9PROT|nr:Na+/H+ antiporter subunit E [Parvularcula dongshanensis]MBB4658520.1 multicomponent Na+:H+ antiporter subunit E [Parvularcula dongshanensis]